MINKKKKRIGRGGKRGTYCGRGIKGQKSRAGRKMEPVIREAIKRYPKLRGYKFKSFKEEAVLNVNILDKVFNDEESVTPEILLSKGLVRKMRGKMPKVKILGKGLIGKKLIVKNCKLSAQAEKKIKDAGGKIELCGTKK